MAFSVDIRSAVVGFLLGRKIGIVDPLMEIEQLIEGACWILRDYFNFRQNFIKDRKLKRRNHNEKYFRSHAEQANLII